MGSSDRWFRLPTRLRVGASGLACFALVLCVAFDADAKAARCNTTDDGTYECQFRITDTDGSFEISAPGKPRYMLNMVQPGVAFGFVNFGARNISLPGKYLRSKSDPDCWINDSTSTSICAR
jgi:hypothetical protein